MQIIDYDMPYEQFLAIFEGIHAEWVDGIVYQLPLRSTLHQTTHNILDNLFTSYFQKYQIGEHILAPSILRVNNLSPARCPDIQILLGDHCTYKHGYEVAGPADIVVEIISEHHHSYERGDKFIEYEQGGVGEYWIIDPIRQECLFYTLDSHYFRRHDPDRDGNYHSTRLNHFSLPIDFLWSSPTTQNIIELVQAM